ncbi:hypothetical protein M422DRAFT_24136 [Sphaerobolus stellatus SS14]|nr:hypothetical protein M422DRAFT_24136 [Sphaerobolus stellatus SS14]
MMSLYAPLAGYWVLSILFHLLDSDIFQWPAKYRIHDSEEVRKKNLVSKGDVIKAVIIQQIIQTLLGYVWLDEGESSALRNHAGEMRNLGEWVGRAVLLVLGEERGKAFLLSKGQQLVSWVYWWGIPSIQFIFAIFIIDTWQYFWHRAMHINKWMYKKFHSVHHRLYVPYAFGALYNHPVEGFILDSLGAAAAEALTGMTLRQAGLLFLISSLKTVDDHCGYALPWDPLQFMFGNNANYHDIHHQAIGIKSNFSQPYFIHWDVLLGTRMTREELEARRYKGKKAE